MENRSDKQYREGSAAATGANAARQSGQNSSSTKKKVVGGKSSIENRLGNSDKPPKLGGHPIELKKEDEDMNSPVVVKNKNNKRNLEGTTPGQETKRSALEGVTCEGLVAQKVDKLEKLVAKKAEKSAEAPMESSLAAEKDFTSVSSKTEKVEKLVKELY